jgi:DNA invertase Pin-like site-specific DNA recombinase
MTLRAVTYARVSSSGQRERDTIASQLRVLPAFIASRGWTLARPIETYVDDGHTAKAGKLGARLGLALLLRDAAAGAFDVVVVVDIDRLTRSEDLTERGAILGALQRAKVSIASAMSGQVLDLATSSGDLFSGLYGFFAAEWSRKHRARVVEGKLTAIQRGRKPSGPTPYGLAYVRDTGVWSVDAERGPIVVEIYERIAAGDSCQAIAADLEARQVPRPRGAWSRERVWRLARSRHVVGEWTVDQARRLVIAVPPIVTEEQWQAVQRALIAHGKRGLSRTTHHYLLEGVAMCGACGAPILIRSSSPARHGRVNPAAYVCRARKLETGGPRCTAPILPCAEADAIAWAAVVRELGDSELPAALVADRARHTAEVRDWEADAAGYRRHLSRLETVEAAMLARYRRGHISDGAWDTESRALNRERDGVAEQLRTAARVIAAGAATSRLDDAVALVASLRDQAARDTPQDRRAVLRALVAPGAVVFRGRSIHLELVLALEQAMGARSSSPAVALAMGPGCRTSPENQPATLRIRTVA